MVCLAFMTILRLDTFPASAAVGFSMIPSGIFLATKTLVVILNGLYAIINAN